MDKRNIKKIISFLEGRLSEDNVMVSQIVLFGSQANGRAVVDSDIDLIIVSESFRGKGFLKRVNMASSAVGDTIRHFHIPIDAILKTPDEIDPDYLKHIGAVIFAA